MNKDERSKLMGEGKISSVLIKFAIPAIIGMLVSAVYNIVDTLFVSLLGTVAIGAVSIVYPLFITFSAIGLMYGIGSASLVSRLLGEKKKHEAEIVTSTTFFTSLMSGLILSVLIIIFLSPILKFFGATETILLPAISYAKVLTSGAVFTILNMTMNNILRAEGSPKYSMLGLTTGAVLNIILDPIFIFTFKMGVTGAALATVISQMVSTILLLSFFLRRKSLLHISIKLFKPAKALYLNLFKIGLPTLIRQLLMTLSMALLNLSAGLYGDAAIASLGITSKVFSIVAMIIYGFGHAFQPIAGYNYGAKKFKRLKETIYVSLKWTTTFTTLSAVFYIIFAKLIISIFSNDPEVIRIGTIALRYMCILFPLFGFQTIYATLFQALGKGLEAGVLSLSRQGIFFIPAILILPNIWGLNGVLIAQTVADLFTIVLTAYFAYKIHHELNYLDRETKLAS